MASEYGSEYESEEASDEEESKVQPAQVNSDTSSEDEFSALLQPETY